MVDLGDLTKAINAQATILEIGAGNDEFLTLYDITETGPHPINRINTRIGAADFYASPVREVTFSCVCTKDIHDKLKALSSLNSRFALTLETFKMIGLALSGATDDITIAFSATVTNIERIAGEIGFLLIRGTLRISNTTYVP